MKHTIFRGLVSRLLVAAGREGLSAAGCERRSGACECPPHELAGAFAGYSARNHQRITKESPKNHLRLAAAWRYAACLLLAVFVGIGNVWAAAGDSETFTFAWGTAGTKGYCYSVNGPEGGALLKNNKVYFTSVNGPGVESSKLNPYKTGFVFAPTTDVVMSFSATSGNSTNKNCSIRVEVIQNDYVWDAFVYSAGQSSEMPTLIFNQADDTEKGWWKTNAGGKVITGEGTTKKPYAAGTDDASKKYMSGETAAEILAKTEFTTPSCTIPGKNETKSFVVMNGTTAYRFESGKQYRLYVITSSSGLSFNSLTFTPVYQLTWDLDGGATSATAGDDYTAAGYYAKGTALTYPDDETMTKEGGFMFDGWSSSETTMPANALTITAQWAAPGSCVATAPGAISKGTASAGVLTLTAEGTPADGNTWYWQDAADGTATDKGSGATKNVSVAGTYYLRSFKDDGGSGCWSSAKSVTVAAEDLLTAINPSLSYDALVVVGATASPTLTGNDGNGSVSYALNDVTPAGCMTIDGAGVITAVAAGTATVTATIAANGYYAGGEATSATIKVVAAPTHLIENRMATGGTTWESYILTNNAHISNLVELQAAPDMTLIKKATNSSGRTIGITSTSGSELKEKEYIYLQFTIESGYELTLSEINIPVFSISKNGTYIARISDNAATPNVIQTEAFTVNNSADGVVFNGYDFSSSPKLTGTVTLKLFAYGWGDGYRMKSPVYIDGTITQKKVVKTTEIELTEVLVNEVAISDADLATLKTADAYTVTLAADYPAAPTVKFNKRTTITYTDESQNVTNNILSVTASNVSDEWKAQQEIDGITYTVKASIATTYTVNYVDEDGTTSLGSELVAVGSHPTASSITANKEFYTFAGWKLSGTLTALTDVSASAGENVTLVASYTPKYATSVNIEQWVLTNGSGKANGKVTAQTTAFLGELNDLNYTYANVNELDTLDESKTARNEPFLGLKWKLAASNISFLLKAGSTVHVKLGNVGSNVNLIIDDGTPEPKSASFDYENTTGADVVVKFQSTGTGTVVFKQIMIDEAIAEVKLPAIVTLDANGGTYADASVKYTGTPLVIGDATPADDDHLFDGWYDGETKIDASGYVPTKNVTLVAKYVVKPSPFSLTALTYTIGAGEAQNVGYEEGTYTYTVELPYAGSYDVITVAATLKEGTSSIVDNATKVLTVTSLPGTATFTVSDGDEDTQLYTINFKKAAKDGVEIIGAVVTGNETATVTGLYKGNASVKLNNKKIDNGTYYIYVTLKEGQTFQDGDVLVVDVNAKSDIGTKALEICTGEGNLDNGILTSIALDDYETGENTIVLASVPADATSIGLKRSANLNAKINGLKVYRPMAPVLQKVTVNGVEGTPNLLKEIEIEVPASTTQGQLEAIAYDWVSNNDAWTAAHTPAAANAWEFGVANTVTLTDKDGDASVYTITVSKAEASHDATLSALSVEGYDLSPAFDPEVLTYNVELAKGTVIGDLPAVSYTLNHVGATAVKTDAAVLPGATTIVVTAEDGLAENKKTYTIHFSVSTKDKVVIFDGATMDAIATSPDASGLSWNVVGSISVSSKSITGYPKALTTGGSTSDSKHIKISVPTKYEAQFEIGQATNSNGNARNAFIKTTAKPSDSEPLLTVSSSSASEATVATSETLAGGKDYYLHSDNSINFVKIVAYLDRVSEAPAISAEPADLAVCDASSNANALSVTASVEAGTLSYQWYKVAEEGDDEAVGTNSASYAPTALGDYYVVITNTEGSYKPSSTKSETATVSQKAATEITGTVNVKGDFGATTQKLSVTATGAGELAYAWYAYDNVNEVTTGAQLSATNELGDLTITEETQYYQVTVTGDCGSVSEILTVSKWIAVEQADVTGSMTWDWNRTSNAAAWSGVANIQLAGNDKTRDIIMANTSSAMPNNEHFRSDMLVTNGEYPARPSQDNGVFQGYAVKFHTTVPGVVAVTYRGTGNSDVVKLQINDWADETGISAGSSNLPTKKMFVPAGDVTIKEKDGKVLRIEKIVFNAEPDYTRSTTSGFYGTICLPNGGVMVGATIYEVAHMTYENGAPYKVFFDEVLNGEMVAGRPYIFQPREGATQLDVFYTDEANAGAGEYNGLHGTMEYMNGTTLQGKYIFYNNTIFMSENTANWLDANRAYIELSEVPDYITPAAAGRRRVSMGVQGAPKVATDVEDVQSDNVQCTKVLIDGQLFIIRGEKTFDAIGRLVK